MPRAPDRPRLVAALVGALAGALLLVGLAGARVAPSGWTATAPRRGFTTAADAGLAPHAWRWQLDPGVRWDAAGAVQSVQVQPVLPEGGSLWLSLGGSRLGVQADGQLQATGMRCGTLPRWAGGELALGVDGLRVDGVAMDCAGVQAGPLRLEAGTRRVELRHLSTDGRPVPARLPLLLALPGLAVAAGVGSLLRLRGALLLPLVLGVAMIPLDPAAVAEALWVQELATPWLPAQVGLGGALLLGVLLALVPALRGRATGGGRVRGLAATLVWAGSALTAARDPSSGAAAVGVLLLLAAVQVLVGRRLLAARLSLPPSAMDRLLAAPLQLAATTALVAATLGVAAAPWTIIALGLCGAAVAWVLLFNLHAARLPRFNLLSLVGVTVALIALEAGAAHTHAARAWQAALTWNGRFADALSADHVAVAAVDDFARMEAARHTVYPAQGYPVAFGPRQAPLRIVAFGGSSTGGAWQFDDLSTFYPARLGARLGPQVEVVNQGVGGWTTWHIRRYAEAQLERLDADILTVYSGNNDGGGGYPAPLSVLFASWEGRRGAGGLHTFERLSLVHWMRVALAPRVASTAGPAVLPAEHGDNLARLVALAGDRPVLIIGEANAEGGRHLQAWHAAARGVAAASPTAHYLHGPDVLPAGQPGLFLDHAHPTAQGHERLAEAIEAALRTAGALR